MIVAFILRPCAGLDDIVPVPFWESLGAREKRDWECWIGTAYLMCQNSKFLNSLLPWVMVRQAKELCCGLARQVQCSAHMSRCRSPDDGEWAAFCWPAYMGIRAARKLASCCDGDLLSLQTTPLPPWMLREVSDYFKPWEGRKVTQAQLDVAERQFGHHLCRLTVRGGQLHIGRTSACKPRGFGPLVVRDIAAAVDALLGAGLLRQDVDFLVLRSDFHTPLPPDVPIFAQGAARCQRGVILLPLNDCIGGLVEDFYHWLEPKDVGNLPQEIMISRMTPPPADVKRKLVWRGSLRGFTRCSGQVKGDACTCTKKSEMNGSEVIHSPRYRLLKLAQQYPEDIIAVGRIPFEEEMPAPSGAAGVLGGWEAEPHWENSDWRRYLFHASVDATAYNTLANWRPLLLGRVLIKQNPDIEVAWFGHGLKAFRHYLPVRFDLQDVRSRLAWAKAHPNETEQIRRAGFLFGLRFVRRCQLYARLHVMAALGRYAKLQE